MSIYGKCGLCDQNKQLQQSHLIPAFAIRWLKKSSATGFIRASPHINKRSQDGLKEYLLCLDCESLFSRWETVVANQIFHPLVRRQAHVFKYEPWLLKFATSVSWRVFSWYRNVDPTEYPPESQRLMGKAISTWKEFLLDRVRDTDPFDQHVLLFDTIESSQNISGLPSNMNRYLVRTLDVNLALSNEEPAFVYAKIGRLAILGFINCRYPMHWKGTKITSGTGIIGGDVAVPEGFLNYLTERATKVAREYKGLSERQQSVIEESYRKNINKAVTSETFRALQEDVRLFGEEAVFPKIKKGENDS
jgi:hypothetical protein